MKCGVPQLLIKRQGDWKSNAFEFYIDISLDQRKSVVNTIAEKIVMG